MKRSTGTSGNRLSSRVISAQCPLMAQELPYYPSCIYTLILFVLPLSALGDTPDCIMGDWGMGGPWRGLTGKGFSLEREGNGVCLLHSSIKKTYLRLHLLNWRHLTRLSNRAIVLATMHQMFPLGIVIGKVHLGDCLSCWARLDGRRCLRWASPTERSLLQTRGLNKPPARSWRLTAERLSVWWSETAGIRGVSLAGSWWLTDSV